MNADGNVIGKDGQVELLVQDAEVLLDLGHTLQGINGQVATRASAPSSWATLPCSIVRYGLGIDDADQDGTRWSTIRTASAIIWRRRSSVEKTTSPEDPKKNRPSTPASIMRLMLRSKGGNVELVVFGIGNNDGRDNAGEFLSCHKNLLSCLASGPMPLTLVGSVQAV